MEEPARGFTQSDDIVVSVFIPYCEAGAEWEIIVNADKPEMRPDLVPLPATEAEVGKVGAGTESVASVVFFLVFVNETKRLTGVFFSRAALQRW